MGAKFEKVSRFANKDIEMPVRKTMYSAGYDFAVVEDTVIQSYDDIYDIIFDAEADRDPDEPISIKELGALMKKYHTKLTLVPTGVKCKLDQDQYLELSIRSSCPLKTWMMLANGVGIIDADYYNNPDNEGEIFFQVINLSPWPIYLKKGDRIGQGIIHHYDKTVDDNVTELRTGGFGSTGA